MKYLKPINEFWGDVLKRDLLGETREEDKFHNREELRKYLKSEIEKQGENVVIQNLDVSHIEDLSWLFHNITHGINTLDISGWKANGVKNIDYMLYDCRSIESINMSGWVSDSIISMKSAFSNCLSLESIDLSGFNANNVKEMENLF